MQQLTELRLRSLPVPPEWLRRFLAGGQLSELAALDVSDVPNLGTALAAGLGSPEHPASVVNVASIAGFNATGMIGWYAVSKAAVIHLTRELAYQLGPAVRVNAVAPAVVKTRFAEALYVGHEEQVASAYPMKRLGMPADIAGAVSFLLSRDAGWITGQTLVVDGGVTLGGAL